MTHFTYDTSRPEPDTSAGVPEIVVGLPEPLASSTAGSGQVALDDPETPERKGDPEGTSEAEDRVAVDEDEVPPARGPETEPP